MQEHSSWLLDFDETAEFAVEDADDEEEELELDMRNCFFISISGSDSTSWEITLTKFAVLRIFDVIDDAEEVVKPWTLGTGIEKVSWLDSSSEGCRFEITGNRLGGTVPLRRFPNQLTKLALVRWHCWRHWAPGSKLLRSHLRRLLDFAVRCYVDSSDYWIADCNCCCKDVIVGCRNCQDYDFEKTREQNLKVD